jgi:hypothetical protein
VALTLHIHLTPTKLNAKKKKKAQSNVSEAPGFSNSLFFEKKSHQKSNFLIKILQIFVTLAYNIKGCLRFSTLILSM